MSTPPVRHTDKKREAILQAAIAEFCRGGYDSTSMDKIAASAEVSKRTVYNHFPGKEALFEAILHELWERVVTAANVSYQPAADMTAQLTLFLQRKMALLCDQSFIDLARVAVAATIHTPDRARDMVERIGQNEMSIVAWIRAAQADGRLRADEDAVWMGELLVGMMKALAFWPQVAMGQAVLDAPSQSALIDSVVKLFIARYQR